MKLALVTPGHPLRQSVETFIADTYLKTYGAHISTFAPTLVAKFSESRVQCAAALRFEEDGFFSECYVDEPFETILSRVHGHEVDRHRIFEVSSLSSCSPADAPRFVNEIVAFGENARFDWAIFTATARLRRLLERIRLPLLTIAQASADCVTKPDRWGTYYESMPMVLAVPRHALALRQLRLPEAGRAIYH